MVIKQPAVAETCAFSFFAFGTVLIYEQYFLAYAVRVNDMIAPLL